ncbi:hypothetical protein AMJ80_01455 [bacterium SM23_31]|nr:MAG: hypothetical protein AMJ80_01455 [bacterium SM23_31]
MKIRQTFAENFYAGDIERQIESFIIDYEPPAGISSVAAGVVPHAGWMFSGKIAARIFASIKNFTAPETIVLFGTVHNIGQVKRNSVFGDGAWETPLGVVNVDNTLAQELLDAAPGLLFDDPAAHDNEHSIEVQIPFIKYLLPGTRIVPVAVLPDKNAAKIGETVAEVVQNTDKDIAAVGTTDLTHYGYNYGFAPAGMGDKAHKWMHDNDMSIINLALDLDAEAIIDEAKKKHNACGSGALAATAAFAKKCGVKKGRLLDYTTSYDIMPDEVFTVGVGYAGILF